MVDDVMANTQMQEQEITLPILSLLMVLISYGLLESLSLLLYNPPHRAVHNRAAASITAMNWEEEWESKWKCHKETHCIAVLNKQKCHFFFYKISEQEGRKDPALGGGSISGRGKEVRKGCGRLNIVHILCAHVYKWKNDTC
jgi:hypothetical protein